MQPHIIISQLPSGYFRLTAEEGYRLYNPVLERYFSEAVVSEESIKDFIAVPVDTK